MRNHNKKISNFTIKNVEQRLFSEHRLFKCIFEASWGRFGGQKTLIIPAKNPTLLLMKDISEGIGDAGLGVREMPQRCAILVR